MIIFLDENDVEYGALATIKATNAVNGERSITGEIISGDVVLSRIERGWRLRFEDEYYVVTFAKPIDEGKNVQVSFDAVHQFFWDFGKSSVYDQLSDGSHTFKAYLEFIFNGSGYKYDIETSLMVKAFEKQSFGYKNRLSLFNDIITSSGVEFQVNGKVVRILAKVGTDLSTVVRKNFNLNELGIEKNIGDFVTYQKGFGAYFDEEDHSKGRLIAEYTSPLASVYGKLEADPLVDERYKQQESLLSALKETVDNSYTISVSLDMEDLTRAGYRYTQPVAGDYIMAINETLGFKEKIRIVSFTSEYDVAGQLIKHTVTCNDIGLVKKLSASYTHTQHQAANAEVNANTAYEFANKALVSANGKNTNYYGDTFPVDNPKGTLKKGDLLFLTVGDTVKQYYWNGAEWVTNPVVSDVEAFKEQISEELKDVPNREEFENKISEELANSKAEIETQIETAKTQAESNAKEYADTINQETAKVAELANAAADEIKADLVNVKNNLTDTSLVANNAQAAVDSAKQDLANVASKLNTTKQDLANVASELNTTKQNLANSVAEVNTKVNSTKEELTQAKQDLMSHAQQLQTQANAQSELTTRVSSVEETANGTKTTVSELSKTVAQNGKDITSVTARTKTVEDDLSGTKTTLSQVQTTADSASQKTAALETGLNGLSARFSSLKIGGRNLLTKTNQGKTNWSWAISSGGTTAENYDVDGVNAVKLTRTKDSPSSWDYIQYQGLLRNLIEPDTKYTLSFDVKPSVDVSFTATLMQGDAQNRLTNSVGMGTALADVWTRISCVLTSVATLPESLVHQVVYLQGMPTGNGNWLVIKNIKLEKGNVATDYSPSEVDLEQKVAEYKQTADQNYASLSSTVQTLDGQVQSNKTTAEQTAQGFKTRIESLETYKNGESERANAYFESAKTETAKQLTAERTAIANNYVAKSTYTSDVTGIRNELSATTSTANATKTNLANYQASNDKMVASLRSSLQTTDGNVSNLQTKVEAVPGQITSAVSAVEGKIPTNVSTRNLILKSNDFAHPHKQNGNNTTITSTNDYFIIKSTGYTANAWGGMSWNMSISEVKAGEEFSILMPVYIDSSVNLDNGWNFNLKNHPSNSTAYNYSIPVTKKDEWFNVAITFKTTKDVVFDTYPFYVYLVKNGLVRIKPPMLVRGNLIPSDYQPAFEDTESDITKLNTTLTQTADGLKQLSTQVTSQGSTITSHTNSINSLTTGLSAKVSQTDFNTLSGRVTTAENNITAKANELSSKITSVKGLIPTSIDTANLVKGTGSAFVMGYGITNTTWDDDKKWAYLDLTDPNVSTAKGSEILPQGQFYNFKPTKGMTYTQSIMIDTDATFNPNGQAQCSWFANGLHNPQRAYIKKVGGHSYQVWSTYTWNLEDIALRAFDWQGLYTVLDFRNSGTYLAFYKPKLTTGTLPSDWSPSSEDYDAALTQAKSEIKQTTDAIKASVTSLNNSTVKTSSLTINADGIVMKAGKSTTDVANAIGSYFAVNQNAINLFADKIKVKGDMIVDGAITSNKIASKSINTAHLNGKIITADVIATGAITANAIKAGAVTTDKMTANSINGDRITAGTLDAAKIKAGSITASQIASGTITSAQIKTGTISAANIAAGAITTDKIAANSINSSKIVSSGITANVIKGGKLQSLSNATNFELDTGKLFYNNNNTGVFRVQNGASTMGLKFSNTSLTVNGTSRILSRAILGGDRRESTLDDGKWDKGGFSGLVIETIKGVEPATNEHADALRAISDTIYFTHTYSADSPTGVSAHGWKMETYAPNSSYSGNIVLKPYGINYRQSDIIVGDVRLDNGDGSGYWMRATINTLKACFGHILNGGTSSQALNAIRSELNKISGT